MIPALAIPETIIPGALLTAYQLTLIALILGTAVVSLLLFAERPRIERRTIVALVPWMVAGAALYVFAHIVQYPTSIQPLVDGTTAYLSTYVVLGMTWFVLIEFSPGRDPPHLSDYVGAIGVGVAVVLVFMVLLHGGAASILDIVFLTGALVVAGLVSFVVLLLLGLWYIDAPAYTGVVGTLVVFGGTLTGLSTVIGVGVFDALGHSTLSWLVLSAAANAQAIGIVDQDLTVLWAWGYIWLMLVLATSAVVLLTRVTRDRPSVGYLLLGAVAAAGITSGTADLLLIVAGGPP